MGRGERTPAVVDLNVGNGDRACLDFGLVESLTLCSAAAALGLDQRGQCMREAFTLRFGSRVYTCKSACELQMCGWPTSDYFGLVNP